MDLVAIGALMAQEEEDEEEECWLEEAAVLAMCCGILEDRYHRAQQRRLSRHYLTRPDLLPNPRGNTPWQQLYETHNDKAFITTMGFTTDIFDLILEQGGSEGNGERGRSRRVLV
jgi:hypothetical protein